MCSKKKRTHCSNIANFLGHNIFDGAAFCNFKCKKKHFSTYKNSNGNASRSVRKRKNFFFSFG